MRKIESAEEVERRRNRNSKYLTFFMLAILLVSTIGYAFFMGDKEDSGNTSTNEDVQWIDIGEQRVYLSNPKSATENISVDINANLGFYGGEQVYVVSSSQTVSNEIFAVLGRVAGRMQNACYGNCTENLPEKDCADKLIVWDPTKEDKVYQEDNCVFIDGDLRAVDAFLYKIFGN